MEFKQRRIWRFKYTIINSMEQSLSWEGNSSLASHEISGGMQPEFHYWIHRRPPRVPILNQTDPLHTSPFHFLKIHFNIILPSTSWSSKWSFRSSHQSPVWASPLPHTCYIPLPFHSSWFDLPSCLPTEALYEPLLSPIRATFPSHLILLDLIFLHVFPPKPCMSLSSLPYVLHSPPISFFLIWSSEWYVVRSTQHNAPRYEVFSTPLSPRPSYVFLSTLFSNSLPHCESLSLTPIQNNIQN